MAACAPPARGKGVGVGEVHFLERSAGLLLGFFFFLLFPFFFFPSLFLSFLALLQRLSQQGAWEE